MRLGNCNGNEVHENYCSKIINKLLSKKQFIYTYYFMLFYAIFQKSFKVHFLMFNAFVCNEAWNQWQNFTVTTFLENLTFFRLNKKLWLERAFVVCNFLSTFLLILFWHATEISLNILFIYVCIYVCMWYMLNQSE